MAFTEGRITGKGKKLLNAVNGMGISLRIALITWLVAMVTLCSFVLLTIPQQKKLLFKHRESKANSVAVSLHDVAAGAAINEDYASVVMACQTLLDGDKDIVFLIVMRNDGFSMVTRQGHWAVNPDVGPFWKPAKREFYNAVSNTPLYDRPVFHHAEPFGYSGIEWGWIHVGLSLDNYNKSVQLIYRSTLLWVLQCAILSLLVSILNARMLVKPILRLQEMVRIIAGGDLSVRTEINREDELGSLARSVNVMAEALQDTRNTLEQRVRQRTRELETQVAAKEQALTELARTQSSLIEASRAAGMAEVATGVLHNVGNVLNSVNVSCTLIVDQLRNSRMGNIARLADLVTAEKDDLGRFFTKDPRGVRVPEYLGSLAAVMDKEHRLLTDEARALYERVDHIKEIVTMQQTYGRVSGVMEKLPPERLMEDALTLNAGSLARHGIDIRRNYETVPPILVDKHKVLQILLNLINNAKHACCERVSPNGEAPERSISLHLFSSGENRISMQVADNGVGILKENLIKIFQHGFTTRRSGHGFGLHSGALAAGDLGGRLSAASDGPGRGALFTLELPCRPKKSHGE